MNLIASGLRTQLFLVVPSGKLTVCYGKSPCYQWVNPLFLWSFSIAMLNYQRVSCVSLPFGDDDHK
jgi:hypothetical protein